MQLSEAQEYLTNGVTFLKYGRRGRPKPRHIFLIEKAISWREPGSQDIPKSQDQKKFIRYMPILDFKEIIKGRDSEIFKRFKIKKETEKYREQLSFTISAGKRTLDLEAPTENELNQFIQMLSIVQNFIIDEERANQGKTAIEQNYRGDGSSQNAGLEGGAADQQQNITTSQDPFINTLGPEGKDAGDFI